GWWVRTSRILRQKAGNPHLRLFARAQPAEDLHERLAPEGDRHVALLALKRQGRVFKAHGGKPFTAMKAQNTSRQGKFSPLLHAPHQLRSQAIVIGAVDQRHKLFALAHARKRRLKLWRD